MAELMGIQLKIYPTHKQAQFLTQNIGNARFAWNQMLQMWKTRYQNNTDLKTLSKYSLNYLLPAFKKEYPFLKESEASSLQFVCETLHGSFLTFFEGIRKHPRFKSKHKSKQSFTMKNNHNIQLKNNRIKLPKIGWVKARGSSGIDIVKIKRVTITLTPSGSFVASLLVEGESQTFEKTGQQIGLDVGQSILLTGSNGLRVPSKTYLQYEDKLKVWQKKQARRARLAKQKGLPFSQAKNVRKAKQMVAKYHEKIRNCRKDYLHKITTQLVKDYDFIVVEDLAIQPLMQHQSGSNRLKKANNHKVANQSWSQLVTMLAYKSERSDKTVVKVSPKYTTQDCSACSERTGPKNDLSIRNWTCTACHVHHDRDVNAAKNILRKGLLQVA